MISKNKSDTSIHEHEENSLDKEEIKKEKGKKFKELAAKIGELPYGPLAISISNKQLGSK